MADSLVCHGTVIDSSQATALGTTLLVDQTNFEALMTIVWVFDINYEPACSKYAPCCSRS